MWSILLLHETIFFVHLTGIKTHKCLYKAIFSLLWWEITITIEDINTVHEVKKSILDWKFMVFWWW